MKAASITDNVDSTIKALEEHYRKFDLPSKAAVSPTIASLGMCSLDDGNWCEQLGVLIQVCRPGLDRNMSFFCRYDQ